MLALFLLGACGSPPPAPAIGSVAPYVYVGGALPALAEVSAATGVRRFVLSFLLAAEGHCAPRWSQGRAVADQALLAQAQQVRDAGGALTVASGGARGRYLEHACSTPHQLADAYGRALSLTGADTLDVDVERPVPVERVASALALARQRHGVSLVVTVPVRDAETGLGSQALALLRALDRRDVPVTANAMIMNLPQRDDWRRTLFAAAERVTSQLQRLWRLPDRSDAYARLGLTFMAGRNDTGPVTTRADARALREFATDRAVGFLGFWSLGRDNGDCPGLPTAVGHCSGIRQPVHAFTRSLAEGPRPAQPTVGRTAP
ncbi:carbohydrate-binding protein CenC [Saccharomonospora piscinae]|uniref:carbohydrate-binding protein CenC n=1 Tax=Saccharomonospora piscinae TaxID=687388 RepID=UPI001FC9FB54|nr:carbohydrate-binding protein CenC [Saccharomonospora piscinae]